MSYTESTRLETVSVADPDWPVPLVPFTNMTVLTVPLSVLDLSPVPDGFTPGDALRNSIDLVQHAERLGYLRYWVAEHHNHPGVACTSPPVLLAHLAAASKHIRVGSGGVMLPNHSSLVVAEQFGMLEAFHPGRIDLGVGRAPGTDPLTASAIRRVQPTGRDDFADQLTELFGYFDGTLPLTHPYHRVVATSGLGYRPAIWMLGSSDYGAHAAGMLGLPYSFAHHFAADNTMSALATYRQYFRPPDDLTTPYASIGVNVVCAPTDDEAEFLAGSVRLSILRLRTGRPSRFPSPQEAAGYRYTTQEAEHLVDRTQVNELIITTMIHDHALRIRSFELLAAAAGQSAVPD
jgi:luciferase family oxidoreductase group 1